MQREITIASTTDSQEEVNSAAGLSTVVEDEEQPTAGEEETPESDSETEESEESSDSEESEESEEQTTEGKEKKPRKSGFQKRIDKLTKRNYGLEEENNRLRQELARGQATPSQPAKVEGKTQDEDERPDAKNYSDNPDKYIEDLADWKARKTVREMLARHQQETAQSEQQEQVQKIYEDYNRRVSEARGVYEDFDEVVGNENLKIPRAAQLAIIEMENGPEVAYFLGSNPDICELLASLSDVKAIAEIGVISRSLSGEEVPDSGEKPSNSASTPITKKVTSAAPKPISPVRTKTVKSSVPMDQLTLSEYRRRREEQRKARY